MEGLEAWEIGDPLEEIDWLQSVMQSPRPVPGVPLQRNLSGISFAVGNVTGCLAALLSEAGDGRPAAALDLLSASRRG